MRRRSVRETIERSKVIENETPSRRLKDVLENAADSAGSRSRDEEKKAFKGNGSGL